MKIEILGKNLKELEKILQGAGFQKFRAKQIMDYLYKRHIVNFSDMLQLPTALRTWLEENCMIGLPKVVTALHSPDGLTVKLLLELDDAMRIEAVLMRQSYGNSVCVSSQVGCAMGCIFCASTQGGLYRNLKAHEIVGQVLLFSALLKEDIHSIVVMGAGEPLQNYDAVLETLRFLHEKESFYISYRKMTLSTCGLVEGILRLSEENIPITLALSLHAPNDNVRRQIMPIAKHYEISQIMDALEIYYAKTERRVTFEYILIDGINSSLDDAHALGRLIGAFSNGNINLIPVNGNEHIDLYKPSTKKINSFVRVIETYGLAVTVRKEMGAAIQAACGQLKAAHERKE